MLTDTFRGDNDALISSIEALVDLSDKGALIPHGIGGHAKALLCSAASRIKAGAASRDAEVQRLQMALADAEALELGTAEKCDQLRDELVKALAACKVKDEALEKACNRIEEYGFEIGEYWRTGRDALASQPGDSALKAWLGKPASYLYKHYSAFGDGVFWSHRPTHQGVAALETKALYSPKGLK